MLAMLDVAIGMSFTYLLLSLLCTAINEWWATFHKMRGKMLVNALSRLVEPDQPESRESANRILNQPEVRALSPGIDLPPSYIPRAVFVRAALKAGLKPPTARPPAKAKGAAEGPGTGPTAAGAEPEGGAPADEEAVERLRAEWGDFFDATMDRATGWYKRQLQVISLCVAIGLTVFANADSIRLADRLWRSPTLRAQFIEAAQRRVEQGKPIEVETRYPDPNNSLEAEAFTVGGNPEETAPGDGGTPPLSDAERDLLAGLMGWREDYARINAGVCARYQAARDALCDAPDRQAACDSLQRVIDADSRCQAAGVHLVPTDAWPGWAWFSAEARDVVLLHLFGWLLTIAAISVGAPLWFDTLSRFVNIRGSGKPPKSGEPKPAAALQVAATAAVKS